jgi:hypothetical protein
MNKNIEVVILTKSIKNGGYCVAGIDINTSKWVRLVSSDRDSHGALFEQDIQYRNGMNCEPLDVARVPILRKMPTAYQPENVLIDETQYWEKVRKVSIGDVLELHPSETHNYLLGNIYPYITKERIDTVGHSLILVKVGHLVITHPRPQSTKAKFKYRFTTYDNISITDPDFYNTPDQTNIGKAILVMSLPIVPYQERKYYKFIAKIFPL